jgi:hypothetical protein
MVNIIHFNIGNKQVIIHKKGFLLNLSTGHIYSTRLKNNYLSIITKKFKLDKLIYCCFNGIPYTNKLYLKHLDGNLLNNDFYNLEIIEKTKYMQTINYKYQIYNSLNYIILYKKYTMDYTLLNVYTNHKFITEYNINEKELFLIKLLDNNFIVENNFIWEIEIITIDTNNLKNYKCIENCNYKIALDNSHILDSNNNIIKYNKINNLNKQYIDILDNNQKNIRIIYEYIDYIDYFPEYNNILKDEDFFNNYDYELDKIIFEKF